MNELDDIIDPEFLLFDDEDDDSIIPAIPHELLAHENEDNAIVPAANRQTATTRSTTKNYSSDRRVCNLFVEICQVFTPHAISWDCCSYHPSYSATVEFGQQIQSISLFSGDNIQNCVVFHVQEYYSSATISLKIESRNSTVHKIWNLSEVDNGQSKLDKILTEDPLNMCFEQDILVPIGNNNFNAITVVAKIRLVSLHHCISTPIHKIPHSLLVSTTSNVNLTDFFTELHLVALLGNRVLLSSVIQSLARTFHVRKALGFRSTRGYLSVLDILLLKGNVACVKELLQRAGNLCFQGTVGDRACAIHHAVRGGSAACLAILLRFLKRYRAAVAQGGWGASFADMLEWSDEHDMSPLLAACALPHVDIGIVKVLLRFGAHTGKLQRPEQQLHCVSTPLLAAVTHGRHDIVIALLAVKKTRAEMLLMFPSVAQLTEAQQLARGRSCYWAMRRYTGCLTGVVSRLCGTCARLSSTSSRCWCSQSCGDKAASSLGQVSLSELQCNPCQVDQHGKSALLLAAEYGHMACLQALLNCGMSYTVTDTMGNTIIHAAAKNGHAAVCAWLLAEERARWRVFRQSSRGHSVALMQGRCKIFQVKNSADKRPQDLASEAAHVELAQWLESTCRQLYSAHDTSAVGSQNSSASSLESAGALDELGMFTKQAMFGYPLMSLFGITTNSNHQHLQLPRQPQDSGTGLSLPAILSPEHDACVSEEAVATAGAAATSVREAGLAPGAGGGAGGGGARKRQDRGLSRWLTCCSFLSSSSSTPGLQPSSAAVSNNNHIQVRLVSSSSEPEQVKDDLDEDDPLLFGDTRILDDFADNEEFNFALAPKGIQSQSYYSVLAHQNVNEQQLAEKNLSESA